MIRYVKKLCKCAVQCNILKEECIHKNIHQFSQGCIGICKHYGYPECIEVKDDTNRKQYSNKVWHKDSNKV